MTSYFSLFLSLRSHIVTLNFKRVRRGEPDTLMTTREVHHTQHVQGEPGLSSRAQKKRTRV